MEGRSDSAGVRIPPPLFYVAGFLLGLAVERALPLSRPPLPRGQVRRGVPRLQGPRPQVVVKALGRRKRGVPWARRCATTSLLSGRGRPG